MTRESFTGRVLGMQQTSTKPPAAAAREAARDVLLVLLAGLAQVRVQVDEAGQEPCAGALDDPHALARGRGRRAASRPTRVIAPALDDDVDLGVERARRVDGAYAAEDEGVHRGAASNSTVAERRFRREGARPDD